MSYWGNLLAILKGDGIALDVTEGAILGAPDGETISLWSAMEARHGWWLACLSCAFLSLTVQWDHCHKQLIGAPMQPANYVRAVAALIAVPTLLGWSIWRLLCCL